MIYVSLAGCYRETRCVVACKQAGISTPRASCRPPRAVDAEATTLDRRRESTSSASAPQRCTCGRRTLCLPLPTTPRRFETFDRLPLPSGSPACPRTAPLRAPPRPRSRRLPARAAELVAQGKYFWAPTQRTTGTPWAAGLGPAGLAVLQGEPLV